MKSSSRPPWTVILRFGLLATIIVGAAIVLRWTEWGNYLSREFLASTITQLRASWWAPVVFVFLYLVASPLGLPISPLVFAGGAAFGIKLGWFYNFLGAMLGALATFFLARALGHDFIAHLAGEKRLRRIEGLLERHGFWTIVRSRFIVPFAWVNIGAALVGVRLTTFTGATIIGLAPSILIYTYFGHALYSVSTADRQTVIRNLVATVVLALAITLVIPLRAAWKRRRYLKTEAEQDSGQASSRNDG